jgi:choline-sulfatase
MYDEDSIPLPEIRSGDVALDPHTERLRHVSNMDAVEVTDADVRRARRAYYGNISYLDEWTARLMQTLHSVGAADDTIVVVLADHGDMLGERGLWYKMNFFEGSARVPLIVHSPQRFTPKRISQPVSLLDILPTITDLAGDVAPDSVDPLAGQSLLDLCEFGDLPQDREVIGEYMGEGTVAPLVMIRRGDLKYVHSPVDPDQLYDLAEDPDERVNLAEDHDWSATVKGLRAEVERRWDMDALTADVIADQKRRRLVDKALRTGVTTPWEYTPPQDGAHQYMRNHMDLNVLEFSTRWPPAEPLLPEGREVVPGPE